VAVVKHIPKTPNGNDPERDITFVARVKLFEFTPAPKTNDATTLQNESSRLNLCLTYCDQDLNVSKHMSEKVTFDKVFWESNKSYLYIRFVHPDTVYEDEDGSKWFVDKQRLTYIQHGEQFPAQLNRIVFSGVSPVFSIALDNGMSYEGVKLRSIQPRADLVNGLYIYLFLLLFIY
jgi:hypothetical protein